MNSGKTLLSFSLFLSLVHGFSFSHNSPTQCDPFTVSWSGGTPPFSLLLTPAFDNPRNFSIPDSAVTAGSGNFSVQLTIPAGQQFVAALSDATGFGTGGLSDLLTVGSSVSGSSCSTQIPTPGFEFELNSPLQQCQPYPIDGYDGATQPVTITGLIPLGIPFQLHPATGPPSFVWDHANVPAGTEIIFFLTDAAGKFGGSSHVIQVGSSNDNSCINDQSPSSTAHPAPTATGGSPSRSGTAPTATVTVPPAARVSAATIGGAVVGGLLALLVVSTLGVFLFKKNRTKNRYSSGRSSHHFDADYNPRGGLPYADLLQPNSANPLQQVPSRSYSPQNPAWSTFSSSSTGPAHVATDHFQPNMVNPPQQVPYHLYDTQTPPRSTSSVGQTYSAADPSRPNFVDSTQQAPRHPYGTQVSPWTTFPPSSEPEYITEPYVLQPPYAGRTYASTAAAEHVRTDSLSDMASVPTEQPSSSSKSPPEPPVQRVQRLILHTDAEDIELPPQYIDRSGSHSHLPPS